MWKARTVVPLSLLLVILYCGVAAAVPHLNVAASKAPSSYYLDLSVMNTNKKSSTFMFKIKGVPRAMEVLSVPEGWKASKSGKNWRAPGKRTNPATIDPGESLSGFRILVSNQPSEIRYKIKNYLLARGGNRTYRGSSPVSVPEPMTAILLGLGLGFTGLVGARRRKTV